MSILQLVKARAEQLLPSDVSSFVRAIVEAPDDSAPKLVFADWLEERDDQELAFAFKWMGEKKRMPSFWIQEESYSSVKKDIWEWACGPEHKPNALPDYVCGSHAAVATSWFRGETLLHAVSHLADRLMFLRSELSVFCAEGDTR